jgi:hypothetical protein
MPAVDAEQRIMAPHHRGSGRAGRQGSDKLSPIPDVPSADERSEHETPKHRSSHLAAKDLLATSANGQRSHLELLEPTTTTGAADKGESITGMLNNFSKALGDIRDIREKRMKSLGNSPRPSPTDQNYFRMNNPASMNNSYQQGNQKNPNNMQYNSYNNQQGGQSQQ